MSTFNSMALRFFTGSKIKLESPLFYCTKDNWEAGEIPSYMEEQDDKIYFKAGVPLMLDANGNSFDGALTLGPDRLEIAVDDNTILYAEIVVGC